MDLNYTLISKALGVSAWRLKRHKELFTLAFTHRSSVGTESLDHNERLEFLGDAVLELIITDLLFKKYPDLPEGGLTSYRSALVKRETLAQVAKDLDLGPHLIMSESEKKSGGAEKDYLLANLIEAIIGALYQAFGMKEVTPFINQHIGARIEPIVAANDHVDPKSELQELTQGTFGITPRYEVLHEEGKDHQKSFTMAVMIDVVKAGEGSGGSKKEAQIEAATEALENRNRWWAKVPSKKI